VPAGPHGEAREGRVPRLSLPPDRALRIMWPTAQMCERVFKGIRMSENIPFWLRLVHRADGLFLRAVQAGIRFFRHLFYFSVLGDRGLQFVTDLHYGGHASYDSDAHNRRGLFPWEAEALEKYFGNGKRFLVTSCGGGREVLALAERGCEVVGTECHRGLCRMAERICETLGNAEIHCLPPEEIPHTSVPFDGVIVGWGGYTHLAPRSRRVAYLRKIRDITRPGGSVLVSYLEKPRAGDRSIEWPRMIANILRRLTFRRQLEPGDTISIVGYSHRFAPSEAANEAREAGLEVIWESAAPHMSVGPYPHLVARRQIEPGSS